MNKIKKQRCIKQDYDNRTKATLNPKHYPTFSSLGAMFGISDSYAFFIKLLTIC